MSPRCPGCEEDCVARVVGTSPDVETGEPVPQLECPYCEAVGDPGEFEDPPLPGADS